MLLALCFDEQKLKKLGSFAITGLGCFAAVNIILWICILLVGVFLYTQGNQEAGQIMIIIGSVCLGVSICCSICWCLIFANEFFGFDMFIVAPILSQMEKRKNNNDD
jgi:hypothetical protein